jgi:hypothetical protein
MSERLLLKARLAERKKAFKELTLRADSYISIIREIIDPYAFTEDFTELDLEKAKVLMKDFYNIWKEAKEIKKQISRMEKDLNG